MFGTNPRDLSIPSFFAACPFDVWHDFNMLRRDTVDVFTYYVFFTCLPFETTDDAATQALVAAQRLRIQGLLPNEDIVENMISFLLDCTMELSLIEECIEDDEDPGSVDPMLYFIYQRNQDLVPMAKDYANHLIHRLKHLADVSVVDRLKEHKHTQHATIEPARLAIAMMFHPRLGDRCLEILPDIVAKYIIPTHAELTLADFLTTDDEVYDAMSP